MKLIAIVIFLINVSIVNAMPEIHFHAKDGRVEEVKKLLDNDPNLINSTTKSGDTPLHWAIRTGRKTVVNVLLEYGANVAAVNNYGNTCLHVAAESHRPELVELMLRKGADIHAKNMYGATPLHEAARTHSNETIRTLLKAGANIKAKNNYGHTPMDKAVSSRRFYEKSLNQDNTRDDLKKGILLYDTTINILSHAEENNAVEPHPSPPHLVTAKSRLDLEKSGDSLILKVLGQKIYLKDINPSQAQQEKYRNNKTQEQFDRWLRQNRKSILSSYFRVLFERYTQEQGIKVTDTDVEQFNKGMQRIISSRIEKAEKKINSLEKELTADNLDDKKRSELNSRLDIYRKSIERGSVAEKIFKSRNSATEKVIIGWKINNQLYKQYGGRVIFQQAGPEPLDAYRKFFEEQQSKGYFEFYNKEAEELFWDYYRNEKIHTFYSDAAEAKSMMDTPWWLHEPEETLSREDVVLWGEDVDGFQIRLQTRKIVFRSNKTATVIVDLLNTGDNKFSCASLDQFFEIEVDGRWYKWGGPEAVDILAMHLSPKKIRYDFAEIKLTDQWLSKEKESIKLNLSLGVHAIRVKYKTMSHPRVSTVQAVSNQIKIKILPPKSKKARKAPDKKQRGLLIQ